MPEAPAQRSRRASTVVLPLVTFAIITLIFLTLAVSSPPSPSSVTPSSPTFNHVIIISIDGLRPDAIGAAGHERLPALHALLKGPHTLNARTDPRNTVTLPNHTDMITGRFTTGLEGHDWTGNVDPPPDATLHKQHGSYVASIFDVAHDHGVKTAIIAGKTKFSLWKRSYDSENGAPDTTGEDNGSDKIDHLSYGGSMEIMDGTVNFLTHSAQRRTLLFLHFAHTDLVGHASGWDLTPGSDYLKALEQIDTAIAGILEVVLADERLLEHTAIILTSDHGGGQPYNGHANPAEPVNYTIPFIVWIGGKQKATDLYTRNSNTRHDPKKQQIAADAPDQPIRNSDAANLAMSLLGLPPVPGSIVNSAQDLYVK